MDIAVGRIPEPRARRRTPLPGPSPIGWGEGEGGLGCPRSAKDEAPRAGAYAEEGQQRQAETVADTEEDDSGVIQPCDGDEKPGRRARSARPTNCGALGGPGQSRCA